MCLLPYRDARAYILHTYVQGHREIFKGIPSCCKCVQKAQVKKLITIFLQIKTKRSWCVSFQIMRE